MKINKLRSLEDDFDGEGAKAPSNETIDKLVRAVPRMKEIVLKRKGIELREPDYSPVRDGGADAHWEIKERYEVLLVVNPGNEPPSYYGDFFDGEPIKGAIDF